MRGEDELVDDLVGAGVPRGGVLLVQSSLRSVGPVAGGADTVVRALRRALGPGGTLVVYTATPENSRSSRLYREATAGMGAPERERHRAAMPAFDPATTPCSPSVGRLAEAVRTTPGALRSAHPQTSFAAVGPDARWIVEDHRLDCHLGEDSPLGRLYKLNASALLVGIPDWLLTPYHLADCRVPDPPRRPYTCLVRGADGERRWIDFEGVDLDDRHFPVLGAAVRERVPFGEGRLGDADCLLVPIVPAVDAATDWLTGRRLSDEYSSHVL
ncbi:aminoglycoside N(3)-acetyltransferase [Streptacidiphilus cavernicola]|uniref:Aminoglycoside N(3)-acetyltransferase n=1 Tax=Streptacidiphilus cavernicola TaxID=3342716 RepID=A0ABV6VNJ7_9ACTN